MNRTRNPPLSALGGAPTAWLAVACMFLAVPVHADDGDSPAGRAPPSPQSDAKPRSGTPAAAKPAIFDTRSYEDAKTAATKEGRWFIVKATAVWCPPCKQMDRTTWIDEKVVAWMKAHGIAVSVDVDDSPEVAEQLEIGAMPTMIAFKDGKEFDRIVGYRSPTDLLGWFEGLERGETSIIATDRRVAKVEPGGEEEVNARYDRAQQLVSARRFAEAKEEFAWVWTNSRETRGWGGVRGSFLASAMQDLAVRNEGAKARFTALRDEMAAAIARERVDRKDFHDWILLNGIIGDDDATIDFVMKAKEDPRWRELLDDERRSISRILIERGQWKELGSLTPDPVALVEERHRLLEQVREADRRFPEEHRAMAESAAQASTRFWRSAVAETYAAVLADGRHEQATAAAAAAISADPSPGLVVDMVSTALKAEQPRAEQLAWLDAALAKVVAEPPPPPPEIPAPLKEQGDPAAPENDPAFHAMRSAMLAREHAKLNPGRERIELLRRRVEAALAAPRQGQGEGVKSADPK